MSQPQPSSSRWARYSIASLSAASTATSFGFTAAKLGTRLGFGAARTVTSTAANLAGLSIDYALFGSNKGTSLALQSLTEPTLSFIESVALTPILVGETITSTSFVAARTSVDAICAISAALGGTSTNSNNSDPNNPHDNALTTMSTMYPGSDDASFSLASFVQLVRREWNEPVFRERVPPDRKLSVSEVARALVAWGVLQAVTQGWQENRWFTALKEIRLDVPESGHSTSDSSSGSGNRSSVGGLTMRSRKPSRLKVTGEEGPVITADIGEAERSLERDGKRALSPISDQYWSRYRSTSQHHHQTPPRPSPPPRLTNEQLKSTLRRLSKMVLGGYGGAGFIFFGVSYHPQVPTSTTTSSSTSSSLPAQPPSSQSTTESTMNQIITAAEEEADSCASDPAPRPVEPKQYSWWNVLLGRHDQELFERYAFLGDAHHQYHDTQPRTTAQDDSQTSNTRNDDNRGRNDSHTHDSSSASPTTERSAPTKDALPKSTAVLGKESEMPRYWVLTDHGRKQIVLVFRGTMSLNELAVDLTCEPAPFKLSHASTEPNFPNSEPHPTLHSSYPYQPFPSSSPNNNNMPKSGDAGADDDEPVYEVHSGMLRIALYMGARGRPVHTAVADALRKNSRYELVLCGHSLGAGVAALLALSWADPSTCLTVPSSGLPPGRRVSCYCFAPPCITDAPLSRLASDMITSFVYSHDIVSRLSLGSVRDMICAATWLAVGDVKPNTKTTTTVIDEAGKLKPKVEAKKNTGEGSASVTARAIKWKTGFGSEGDEEWFLALRKTLEANMTMTHLYPPGRIWWAVRDGDLHLSNRLPTMTTSSTTPPPPGSDKNAEKDKEKEREKTLAAKKVRLFEVTDVEKVFSQIVFARDMLTSHLPDRYDYVLHELL